MNSLAILTSFYYSGTQRPGKLGASAVQRDGLCPGEHDVILQKAPMEGADYSLSAQGIKKGLCGTSVWVSVSAISSNYSKCLYDPPLLYLRQAAFHNYRFGC